MDPSYIYSLVKNCIPVIYIINTQSIFYTFNTVSINISTKYLRLHVKIFHTKRSCTAFLSFLCRINFMPVSMLWLCPQIAYHRSVWFLPIITHHQSIFITVITTLHHIFDSTMFTFFFYTIPDLMFIRGSIQIRGCNFLWQGETWTVNLSLVFL